MRDSLGPEALLWGNKNKVSVQIHHRPPTLTPENFVSAILINVQWYLITIFIYISLMTNNIECLMCLFSIHIYLLVNYLLNSLAHLLIMLLFYYFMSLGVVCIFWIKILCQICDQQIVFHSWLQVFFFSSFILKYHVHTI